MSSEEDYIVNAEMGVKEMEGMLISGVSGDRKHFFLSFSFFFLRISPGESPSFSKLGLFFPEVPCVSSTISLCRVGVAWGSMFIDSSNP